MHNETLTAPLAAQPSLLVATWFGSLAGGRGHGGTDVDLAVAAFSSAGIF